MHGPSLASAATPEGSPPAVRTNAVAPAGGHPALRSARSASAEGRGRNVSGRMYLYAPEEFTAAEADILRRYVTNLDQPVFCLVNLPEVVKGALFARYSRSAKTLRRLFLDEFVG